MDSLELFLSTGRFKDLELNMPLDQVLDVLGPPDGVESVPDFYREIEGFQSGPSKFVNIDYGNLQLSFDQGKLWYIAMFFRDSDDKLLPEILEASWLPWVYQLDTQQFIAYAARIGLQCEKIIYPRDYTEFIHVYIPRSRVTVVIDLEGTDRIYSISTSTLEIGFPTQPWP